jgi:hypothetical protein
MADMDWRRLEQQMREFMPGASSISWEFPGVLYVYFNEPNRHYVAGTANPTWNIDYYDSDDESRSPYSLETHLPSHHEDPWLVALNIAATISRHEVNDL